jgi:hypothetical protein
MLLTPLDAQSANYQGDLRSDQLAMPGLPATVNRVLREEEERGHLTLECGRTIVHDAEPIARRIAGMRA